MYKIKDLSGQRYGRLTVIERRENDKWGASQWLCKCDCGVEKVVQGKALKKGLTKSCGCLGKETRKKINTKHGQSNTRLYRIWHGIKDRCYNANNPKYKNYGGRGITVCDEWRDDFQAFYKWAIENGYKENLTIDRINNKRGYNSYNCRWITNEEQQNNKRNNRVITYNGKTQTLTQWAKEYNISPTTLTGRLERGWDFDDALQN